jgi:hypothetical protein
MKKLILILFFFICSNASAQYKEGISIVKFTASFIEDTSDLKKFKSHNTHVFYIEKNEKIFKAEKIVYMPTIILFNNGKKIKTIEAGISLKLPEEWEKLIEKEIKEILSSKF